MVALWGGLWLTVGSVASADVLPPEVVTYVLSDGLRLRVLVRVPTSLLADARLPVVQPGYLDLANIDRSIREVAHEVVRGLDFMDAGRALPPPEIAWRVVPAHDASFRTPEQAMAHLAGAPTATDTLIYWNEAHVDLQLDFERTAGIARLSGRLNGLTTAGTPGRARATYVPRSGARRTFEVSGPPRRVEFEPGVVTAMVAMGWQALNGLIASPLLLLFVGCVVVPLRSQVSLLTVLAALWCAHAAAVSGVQLTSGPMAVHWRLAAELGAAAVVVGAAMLNVLGARGLIEFAVLFGVTSGLAQGAATGEVIAVAGAYPWPGLMAHEAVGVGVSVLLAMLARPLVGMAYLVHVPAWAVTAALAALPAHEASHAVLVTSSQLAALDLATASPILSVFFRYWVVIALGVTLATLLGVATRSSRDVAMSRVPRSPRDPHRS